MLALALGATTADARQEGAPAEREIAAGETHPYPLTIESGQFVHAEVAQMGANVSVRLLGPDGAVLAEVTEPDTLQGKKRAYAITTAAGPHVVEVRAKATAAATGRYRLNIAAPRAATDGDRARVAARDLVAECARLRAKATGPALRDALGRLQEALPRIRALGDRDLEADALANIGAALFSLSRFRETIETFERALAIWRETGDRRNQAVAISFIAAAYTRLGEWQRVVESQNEALAVYQALGDHRAEATTLNNLGTFYAQLGDHHRALALYERALPLSTRSGDREGEIVAVNNLGAVLRYMGDYARAIEQHTRALDLCRAVANPALEAATLNGLGSAHRGLGKPREALALFERALTLYRQAGDRRAEISTLVSIGNAWQAIGDRERSIGPLKEAVAALGEVRDRRLEVMALYGLAVALRETKRFDEARAHVEAAIALVESLRAAIPDPDLRARYFATVERCYQLYVDLLMRGGAEPDAAAVAAGFRASERARARSLVEILIEARADLRSGVDEKILAEERQLQRLLDERSERQLRLLAGPGESAGESEREIGELTARYEEARARIRLASPRFASLAYPEPLGVEEVQRSVLDEETVLLEYALGDARSYLWAVTTTSVASWRLPGRAEIEAAARRYHEAVSDAGHPERAADAAARLSALVLGPAAGHLTRKRILVVADGALQYVPFAALPKPAAGGAPAKPLRPLVLDHEIVSAPSASAIAVLRRETAGRAVAPKSVAVLADPVFSHDDVRVSRAKARPAAVPAAGDVAASRLTRAVGSLPRQAAGAPLPRLLGTRREARSILAYVPRETSLEALDFDANQTAATAGSLGEYRILHFATHGIVNTNNPELSGIVLSLVDESGGPRDGFLQMHELYARRLPAELVVLSACQTALGRETHGEGLVGLVRGFMYAGSPRVVASLWKVDDRATAELMKRFYRGMLVDGLRPAAALRAAQIELLGQKAWRDSYYWAAFVLQGDWR